MRNYVLVHGGWAGAHSFRKVRPLLHRAGHEVFTPSLTGIGDRVHLVSPQVNLTTHIRDVVNLVLFEDLRDIVLLGFSYGGLVITGALDHIGDRVRHLVYLDAFLPSDGDSAITLAGQAVPAAISVGEPWLVPAPTRTYDDPVDAEYHNPRRVPHPLACFIEPVRLRSNIDDGNFTRTYIKATAEARGAPGGKAFWDAADRVKSSPKWRYREIATTHIVPINEPDELTTILLELA
jgi:pimeloyl-ACP methyl ester carboxylesterase